jgi:hypothetical protein
MTSHRKITFDELEKAQDILKNGFESGVVSKYEISILAKYYFSIGITRTKLKKELIEFCKTHSANFNEIVHRETIAYALRSAEKYNLKTCNDVIITVAEMDIIRNLPYKYAKILFVMLVLAKHSKENKVYKKNKAQVESSKYYCYQTMREIVRIAKVGITNDGIKTMKHFLDAESGYISATEINTRTWEVCIINNDSDIEMIVDNINLLSEYLPIFCEKCKKTLPQEEKSKRHNMCQECYNKDLAERHRISNRNWKRKLKSG